MRRCGLTMCFQVYTGRWTKCELDCGAEMLTMLTHCSTPQVAALALQALKTSYAHPSHFKVEDSHCPHGKQKLGMPAGTCMPESTSLSATTTYMYVHHENRSPIQSLTLMHSATKWGSPVKVVVHTGFFIRVILAESRVLHVSCWIQSATCVLLQGEVWAEGRRRERRKKRNRRRRSRREMGEGWGLLIQAGEINQILLMMRMNSEWCGGPPVLRYHCEVHCDYTVVLFVWFQAFMLHVTSLWPVMNTFNFYFKFSIECHEYTVILCCICGLFQRAWEITRG